MPYEDLQELRLEYASDAGMIALLDLIEEYRQYIDNKPPVFTIEDLMELQ